LDVMPFAVFWPPWAFRLFGSAALRFYWYCFLFRPRQGGSRPHISEGSDFSDFSSAYRCAASRAAPNLKRADSILRSKMPFTWVGPPSPRPIASVVSSESAVIAFMVIAFMVIALMAASCCACCQWVMPLWHWHRRQCFASWVMPPASMWVRPSRGLPARVCY
jgi:hypothetical protein